MSDYQGEGTRGPDVAGTAGASGPGGAPQPAARDSQQEPGPGQGQVTQGPATQGQPTQAADNPYQTQAAPPQTQPQQTQQPQAQAQTQPQLPFHPPTVAHGSAPGGPDWGGRQPPGMPPAPGMPGAAPAGGRPKKRISGMVAAVLATAVLAGGIGGSIGTWAAQRDDNGGTPAVSSKADQANLNRSPKSVAGIANAALPSVVTIRAQNGQEAGTGTGFVYDKQGHILTNNHVVAPAADGGKLSVTFSDGKSYDAKIVGRAQGYDVAVIKLDDPDARELKPLRIGNSDKVAVGDNTIAIGAPYGLSGTVTTGIVSAKDRPVQSGSGESRTSQPSYMSAIQTDASINPGNSGGPLLDANGNVIGINSAIRQADSGQSPFGGSSSSGSIGLGFAIPINQANRVAQDLIKTGKPIYPVIGVLRNDEYRGAGAQIAPRAIQGTPAVTPGGPAAKAGLKAGDVITRLDGHPIDSGPTLVSEIWSHNPSEKVEVVYKRDGESHTVTLTLGKRVGDGS